jgi:hypothetical protein
MPDFASDAFSIMKTLVHGNRFFINPFNPLFFTRQVFANRFEFAPNPLERLTGEVPAPERTDCPKGDCLLQPT